MKLISALFSRCHTWRLAANSWSRLCTGTVVLEPASMRPGEHKIKVDFLARAAGQVTDDLQSKLRPPEKVFETRRITCPNK